MVDAHEHFIGRWQRINAIEIEESRRLSPAVRLRQFFTLLELAHKMNWQTSTSAEIAEIRRRWRKIKGCGG